MVVVINILTLAVYVAGAYIMFKLSLITGILYVIFILVLEFQLYKNACTRCCYYGKMCAFGKGIIVSLFFKKGDPKKFAEKEISFKDLIPQLLIALIPLTVGVALLVSRGFDLLILLAMIYPVFSWVCLNQIIYGKLACKHCSICCPALNFFTKKKK